MVNAPPKKTLNYTIEPSQSLRGQIRVPGDKSISHRALMLSPLAEGNSEVQGLLMGADNLATLSAMQLLGAKIEQIAAGHFRIQGQGLRGLHPASQALDLGNSGTGMRLLAGLLAGQNFNSELIGDESLQSRPMARIANPLKQMGAQISLSAQGTAPLKITGGFPLTGITYSLPIASAQVKSCVLLAGLYAQGETRVIESGISRDHTERMLETFAYPITRSANQVSLQGGGILRGAEIKIPADISSAAFFMVAASITPGSEITLTEVGINPTRTGIITILKLMGADIHLINERNFGQEPVADIVVRFSPLHGITIPEELVPLAIDEFPVIFVAAACAKGQTTLRGASELRVKETDRIAAMAEGLHQLKVNATVLEDGIIINGSQLHGGSVNSCGDHRIAMAFAVAGCVASGPVVIADCVNVETSFPGFVDLAQKIGMKINSQETLIENIAPVITIDGPSGVGKGTIALMLAKELGWHFLDSGVLYRAIAWAVMHNAVDYHNENALHSLLLQVQIKVAQDANKAQRVICNGQDITEEIRLDECSQLASKLSAIPLVRAALLQKQRDMRQFPGLVTDGRDMGTVVFPHATLKFFFTAELKERAHRRYNQLKRKGINVSLPEVEHELSIRDNRDINRTIAPAKPAEDVILVDTTNLSVDQVFERIIEKVRDTVSQTVVR